MLVSPYSNVTHLFVMLLKVIERPVLVVYALSLSLHGFISEVFVVLLLEF